MELQELLTHKKDAIRQKWYQLVAETYPAETSAFLLKKKDRFDNPVGHAISEMADSVLDCLISGSGREETSACLRPLVKIRAVQDFSPSEAVSFAHLLREAVKGVMEEKGKESTNHKALQQLDSAVERISLICFDLYTECREALHKVKEDELKRNLYMLLRQAGMVDAQGTKSG